MRRPARIRTATVVAGARPNFVKVAPVLRALRGRGVEVRLVHTGQHYDDAMSRAFFRDLGIPAPEVDLGVGSGPHGAQTGRVLERFEADLVAHPADAVVVVGDVNSTLAAALAAAKLEVPVAHVEAGLRSFDRAMPEELNRLLTDRIADWLFVTETSGVRNLEREGIPAARIFLVGNVMIDSLEAARRAWQAAGRAPAAPAQGAYAVMTLHRPANVDRADILAGILDAVGELAGRLPVVFPVHPRTAERLAAFGLGPRLAAAPGLATTAPMGYLEFLGLLAGARLILTDSGGAQEEALVLGVPCVTLRESTERPVTVAMGGNRLVGSDPARIRVGIEAALAVGGAPRRPPLWDGRAAERIADILLEEASA
ncbi:MAG: UDP-N-acetylglucosamine 2-epimerase (non-hydrolyzing) [Planctomycetes bacterium]|nr:UDP-N-acetylglucosamine 2-epimerase (non-hydrolyzing) [Planctomycetota bacterium]